MSNDEHIHHYDVEQRLLEAEARADLAEQLLAEERSAKKNAVLTKEELEAIRMAGHLQTLISTVIIGHGATRDDEITTLMHHVHAIQRMVMSQAAARAYSAELRLLGHDY